MSQVKQVSFILEVLSLMNEVIGTDQSSMVGSHLGVMVNLSVSSVTETYMCTLYAQRIGDAATFITVEGDATSDDQGRYRDSAGLQVLREPARMLEELDRVDLAAAPRVTDGN